MANSTPRERRQERTYQAILETAIEIITERGPDNLSLREIARRVDYSPAALYEYFDSKEDIIGAVCAFSNRRLYRDLERISVELSLKAYLLGIGQAYIQYAKQNPELFILVYTRLNVGGTAMPTNSADLDPDDSFFILLRAIENGIDEGLIPQRDDYTAVDIAYGLWATVHGMAMLQITQLKAIEYDFKQSDMRTLELYLNSLVHE